MAVNLGRESIMAERALNAGRSRTGVIRTRVTNTGAVNTEAIGTGFMNTGVINTGVTPIRAMDAEVMRAAVKDTAAVNRKASNTGMTAGKRGGNVGPGEEAASQEVLGTDSTAGIKEVPEAALGKSDPRDFIFEMTRGNVLNGILFSEILGKPRALRRGRW